MVDYDDEVAAEMVLAIADLVASEFETGNWVVVEGDAGTLL